MSIRVVIGQDRYVHNDSYYSIYHNKDIDIKVEIADTSFKYDLSKIKWKLGGREMLSKEKMPSILSFAVNPTNLPRLMTDLLILDSLGTTIFKLKVRTYYAPIVRFEESSRFNGEYLFDRGYEFSALSNPTYYDTMQVGRNKETYFAPVLGLNQDQLATIKVRVDGFTDNVLQDKDFKIVFKPDIAGKIKINGLDSLVLNAAQLDNLTEITIKANDYINANMLTSMSIKVYAGTAREKVGMLQYYCAQKVNKTITLIYTKFKDERTFSSYLTPNGLSQFLNNNSLNQFFLNITIDSLHFTSRKYNVGDMSRWENSRILDSLNFEKFNEIRPSGYATNQKERNYYYITNIERTSTNGEILGGFHNVGASGGVQTKYIPTQYNESAEEFATHELGHWLGLPHTFSMNQTIPLVVEPSQGGTRDNFMDYHVKRKKWLKIQLLKYKR